MGKLLSFALDTVGRIIDRVPIEKYLIHPPDTSADRKELLSILNPEQPEPPKPQPQRSSRLEPRAAASPSAHQSTVTDEETVAYQNREIGKLLLRMERHYAQGLRIAGKVCDCGATKHLIDLEGMAEETIPMVRDPKVYYDLMDWVERVGPISTPESVGSGRYDAVYPELSGQARDFRKLIMGTLDPKALWPHSSASIEDLVRKVGDVRVVSVERVPAPQLPGPSPIEASAEVIEPAAEASTEMPAEPSTEGSET